MSPTTRQCRLDLLIALGLGLGAFVLYVRTLAPTVLAGDGGEFQFVPYLMGVAHPTGYPLYTLLGWAWSHLLAWGNVAQRLNLFSAWWGALAAALLYPTAQALLHQASPALPPVARRLIAALAAATLAVTPTFWSQAVIAEVYTLHLFLVLVVLYCLLLWTERHTPGWLLLAAWAYGLSLAHHRTTLVLAPAFLAYVWLNDRRVLTRDPRRLWPRALGLVLLPLALYLYIPWRAPHTPYLRLSLATGRELVLYDNTLAQWLDFILGGPFGGSVDLQVNLGARLTMAGTLLHDEVGWVGILLAAVGAISLTFPSPAERPRWALLALTGLIFAGTVAFNLVYTIGDVYVLFIPAYLAIVLWAALGISALTGILGRALPSRFAATARLAAIVPFLALPPWLGAVHYQDIDHSQHRGAEHQWEAILAQPLPSGAVLVSDDRNDIMPLWYYQYVMEQRPDLLGLFPLITPDYPTLGRVLDLALSTGRPVYLIKAMPGIDLKVDTLPENPDGTPGLQRVTGPAVAGDPAYVVDAELGGAVALAGYDRSPRSPRPGETLQVSLSWQGLRPLETEYHSYVHLVDGTGEVVAQSDHQPGGMYYPSPLWRPGERLRDDHALAIPPDTPPGVYRLLVGLYSLPGGTLLPLGEPIVAGSVAVKTDVPTELEAVAHPAEVDFDGQIELLGYGATVTDGALVLRLYWRALQPPATDYTVFVHLLDKDGQTQAQHDGQPEDGSYPTSVWDAVEIVVDEHRLSLPAGVLPGDYRLEVGLYRLETGDRLPVAGGGDSADLGRLELEP